MQEQAAARREEAMVRGRGDRGRAQVERGVNIVEVGDHAAFHRVGRSGMPVWRSCSVNPCSERQRRQADDPMVFDEVIMSGQ